MRVRHASGVLVLLAVAAGLALARRHLVVVQVEGTSMVPAYRPGDRVLVRRASTPRFERGQVVVFQSVLPGGGWRTGPLPDPRRVMWFVKRVAAVPGDPVPPQITRLPGVGGGRVPAGRLVVLGDGPVSEDSRHWGYLPVDRVLGVVIRTLFPASPASPASPAAGSGAAARRARAPEP